MALKYTTEYVMGIMAEYTTLIKGIVNASMIIFQSSDKALISRMHYINDTFLNQYERILYGATLKEIYAIEKDNLKKRARSR